MFHVIIAVYIITFIPVLWRRLILKSNGTLTNTLDVSSLAKVTDGYTPGHMYTAITQVLTDRRIQQLSKRPLQAVEFIAPLARIDPIYKEEEEAFKVHIQFSFFFSMIFCELNNVSRIEYNLRF